MSSITSRPPSRSSFDHGTYNSQSQSHNYVSNPIRSPYPMVSPGTLCAPTPGVKAAKQQHQQPGGTGSPAGYFGLVIDPSESTLSINHTKQNWSPTGSSIKSVAAVSPRPVSLENLPLPDSFHKQAQALAFTLHQPNLPNVSEPDYTSSEFLAEKGSIAPSSSAPYSPLAQGSCADSEDHAPQPGSDSLNGLPNYFKGPRTASPFSMESDLFPQPLGLFPRLSAPTSPFKPEMHKLASSIRKSNSMPVPAKADEITPITPEDLNELLKAESNKVLLLDLRAYLQYAQSRIEDAVHLSIPTILLPRPSFNVTKLSETLANEADKAKFARWKDSEYIVVYDADSQTIKDCASAVHIINKFIKEGWSGDAYYLKGGFVTFASAFPEKIDDAPVGGSSSPNSLSLTARGPKADKSGPGAFNCQLPLQTSVCNPFFSNIRQNMDLIGGVGEIAIAMPQSMSNEVKASLPAWLKRVACEPDGSKLVSERFLHIEKAEQERMQRALNAGVSYGSPTVARNGNRYVLAGMEQGTKNRYNNIWPYDHSRVKLRNVPENSCDYVNASHISSTHSNKRYIATQGPLPSTFQDFWSVVWEQDVRVIVMLTAEAEGGLVKCHNYWEDGRYGPLELTKRSEHRVALEPIFPKANAKQRRSTTGSATISTPHDSNVPYIVVRRFSLCHDNYPFEPIREITQLQYSSWPDFGAPAHPAHILALIEHTEAVLRSTRPPKSANSSNLSIPSPVISRHTERPAIVHCSAGCGRTGAFCAVDTVIEMLRRKRLYQQYGLVSDNEGWDVDEKESSDTDTEWLGRDDEDLIRQVVNSFRDQRLSMVQSLRQFVLCYETVLEWFARQTPLESGKRKAGK